MKVFIGWLLILTGTTAIIAGVVGGIAAMLKEIKWNITIGKPALESLPTDFIKVLTEFLKALTKAPAWLALTIIGILLISFGLALI